jgi:hypothetical protein
MVLEIPKLYKTEPIEFDGQKGELTEYKIVDNDLIIAINEYAHEVQKVTKRAELVETEIGPDKLVKEYTIEENDQVQDVWKKIEKLHGEVEKIHWKLAQRGMKRALLGLKNDVSIEELNQIPDYRIPISYAKTVANMMIQLAQPEVPRPEEKEETGNGKKKEVKGKRGRPAKNKSKK